MPKPNEVSNRDSTVYAGVILICRNNSASVQDAIASVLKQDHPNMLLAIVNDGSTDDSEATIRQLITDIQTDTLDEAGESFTVGMIGAVPTILVSHPQVDGNAISKNKGFFALWQKANYFTVMQASDTMSPNKISRCLQVCKENNNVGIVYHNSLFTKEDITYPRIVDSYDRHILEQTPGVPSDAVIPKDIIEATGIFEHTLTAYDDWDFWLRVTERYIAIHIPETLSQCHIASNTNLIPEAVKAVLDRVKIRQTP